MKDKYKIIAVILFVLWLIVLTIVRISPSKVYLDDETARGSAVFSADVPEKDAEQKPYSAVIEHIKTPFDMDRYQGLLTRNIFFKPEKAPHVFSPEDLKVTSVESVKMPFMYSGYIWTEEGEIIGQVNWLNRTYFVKKGERFRNYKVLDLSVKLMKIEGKEGKLTLELKKPVKGKDFIAKLYDTVEARAYEVKKGDNINGYKILDIMEGRVVLYGQGKEWILSEEK